MDLFTRKKLIHKSSREPYDFLVVNGQAGHGKSFTVGMFTHWKIQNNPNIRIANVAPKWTAVSVAQKQSPLRGQPQLYYMTLQALCGMKGITKYTSEGPVTTYEIFPQNAKFDKFDIVIVDEASMVDEDLWSMLIDHIDETRIILVGDSGQLPPVGEKFSKCFSNKYMNGTVGGRQIRTAIATLREQKRTSEDSEVLNLALAVRNKKPTNHFKTKYQQTTFLHYQEIDKSIDNQLKDFFKYVYGGTRYKNDSNFFKLICYTKTTKNSPAVGYWTRKIREALYGESPPYIAEGESILITQPIFDRSGPMPEEIVSQGQEAIVQKLGPVQEIYMNFDFLRGDKNLPYYPATLIYENLKGQKQVDTFIMLTEKGEAIWDEICKNISSVAWAYKKKGRKVGKIWEEFHRINDQVLRYEFDYATTVHGAQGRSFSFIAYDLSDLRRALSANKNATLYRQLEYTALTRPTIAAFILTNK